jgi:hypothetical protein
MIIYNVTVNVEPEIHDEWLAWMRAIHIPEVLATKCFQNARISRLLSKEEDGAITYSIQYQCASMKLLHRYQAHFAHDLQTKHTSRYQGKFVAFRTLMELIDSWSSDIISEE